MERVSSGIPGLDEIIGGGFIKDSTILVSGGPGTGKTTFCLQYLLEGVRKGEYVAFFSFEDDRKSILKNFSHLPGLQEAVDKGNLVISRFDIYEFDTFKSQVENIIDKFQPTRVALDSMTMLGLFFKDLYTLRRSVYELIRVFRREGITAILTSEVPNNEPDRLSSFGIEEFLVDTVIRLYRIRMGTVFYRFIGIIKMRGSKHSENLHPIEITDKGLIVHSKESVLLPSEM